MVVPGFKVVMALSVVTLLTACDEKKPVQEYLPRVFVQVVKPADYAVPVTLTGDIQARVQTELSFRVGGKIIQRSVDVGDRVTAKQVLARLDPKDLQTNVDSAQAQVVAEQARVTQSAAAFVRQQKLLPKGYTSQSEYDSAQATLHSSQSALSAAKAQLANAKDQLSYTALIADAPGIITERQAEVGQVVQATMPIFSLARDGDRDAVFNVYESLLAEKPRDHTIVLSLVDNPAIKTTGTVREITPAVSAQSGTVQVKVGLDKLPDGMQLGSVVSATASGSGKSVIELPWSALTKNISAPAVWIVDDKGKAQLHSVTVGRYLTGKVIISGGLKDGDKVIIAGGQLLHPDMEVEIAENTYKDLTWGAKP
ncbi:MULTISPECIES: efflux RND transporter periplasmic adaptor subunit [Pseudomonas]|jgi:membrane fusion protein, multidrug efflux system|uniref:Multidrug resistance protein MdtE n=2 Tax=Pseudomonas TaxID=286 RepID=A0A5E7TSU9_PSEFL|nr:MULTISPECIES: efflux RND transporter periplasmic adaptor subunit [Pseudomonas]MBV7489683.1 efflux RND transporter periplasmic adaptor subunit [Pseudomonas sp. PDM30]MBV7524953.1 efflux RND transporter periplasmic adaptor subunit [Pseudomonas sp. PDM29]OOQ42049.1 efflux transporter periplasmic adaptor subunit [Pseudomonas fluorescens]OXR31975.1 efflux RND transporter periplasmic adaptor subunit [Pseudomonas jessenii]QHF36876.1 efflux transporter periplasmic adaptor subunit [Pseudomonas sp. S